MLIITDHGFFLEIVADSIVQAHLTCSSEDSRNRWIRAIAKATAVLLEGNSRFLHWNPQTEILSYWSPSDEIYEAGKTCQCRAFKLPAPMPCYHRAMSRLVKHYFEFQRKPGEIEKIDPDGAVFFDHRFSDAEKLNLLNLSLGAGRADILPLTDALAARIAKKD